MEKLGQLQRYSASQPAVPPTSHLSIHPSIYPVIHSTHPLTFCFGEGVGERWESGWTHTEGPWCWSQNLLGASLGRGGRRVLQGTPGGISGWCCLGAKETERGGPPVLHPWGVFGVKAPSESRGSNLGLGPQKKVRWPGASGAVSLLYRRQSMVCRRQLGGAAPSPRAQVPLVKQG